MTNELSTERAIEALFTVRAYYASLTVGYPKGKDRRGIGDVMCSEIANSCLMAIEALEQKTCEDCISREEAIKACYGMVRCTGIDEVPYEYARDVLSDLPSVTPQPKTRWIPCSERLPENEGDYLVTFKLSFMNFIEVCTFNKADWDKGGYDEVIAWMPLPEPYRGEEVET